MLLELRQRSPQRSFPEQYQLGQAISLTDRTQRSAKAQIWSARKESKTFHTACRQGPPEFSARLGIAIL